MPKPDGPGVILVRSVFALHFGHGGLSNMLMMQSPTSGGSAILSVTARYRYGPVMGIAFHATTSAYWSKQNISRKS
jgi:hypothetical protein